MKLRKKILLTLLALVVIFAAAVFGVNGYVTSVTKDQILCGVETKDFTVSEETLKALKEKDADCVLVLGAKVRKDGSPSYMLQDRLDLAIQLYKSGVAPKLLLSGDHGQTGYDEVNAMKTYAENAGVPEEDLFLDHAGFSTYDSVYRAKEIFQVEKMIVVTQGYHLYRALYGCGKMDIQAWGAAADQMTYRKQWQRDLREIAARDKDFVKWLFKPEPMYLGDAVPISGSGIVTQD